MKMPARRLPGRAAGMEYCYPRFDRQTRKLPRFESRGWNGWDPCPVRYRVGPCPAGFAEPAIGSIVLELEGEELECEVIERGNNSPSPLRRSLAADDCPAQTRGEAR